MRQDLGEALDSQFKKIYMSRHENVRYVYTILYTYHDKFFLDYMSFVVLVYKNVRVIFKSQKLIPWKDTIDETYHESFVTFDEKLNY